MQLNIYPKASSRSTWGWARTAFDKSDWKRSSIWLAVVSIKCVLGNEEEQAADRRFESTRYSKEKKKKKKLKIRKKRKRKKTFF